MTAIESIKNIDGQLMVKIPQAVVDALQLTDLSLIEFSVGDAIVTVWNVGNLKTETLPCITTE